MRRLVSIATIGLAALTGAACTPATGPAPTVPDCTLDVRFDDQDRAHAVADTNLPSGTAFAYVLTGNGASYLRGDYTSAGGAGDALIQVPDWGYPVAWDVDVYYSGKRLCSDGALQGARYITDPDWWDLCVGYTYPAHEPIDAECAYDTALQTNPS